MNSLIIEPVPGTRFVFAGQQPDGSRNISLTLSLMLPPWASPELATAWRDSLAANVTGSCPACEAVRSVHPDRKTAGPGEHFKDESPFPHEPWCPCAAGPYEDTVRACSPDGEMPVLWITPDEIERVNAYLALIVEGPSQQPHDQTENDHADTVS